MVNITIENAFQAFVDATNEVLETMCKISPKEEGTRFEIKENKTWGDVTGMVSLPGEPNSGVMSISFDQKCLLSIVESLIGETHKEINQDVKDAAGELTNMISSMARAKLTTKGLELGMDLPFTVLGRGVEVNSSIHGASKAQILNTDNGSMQISVIFNNSFLI